MPSHSVKQAKVMSAIAHGWHPSGLDIPVKVAKDFHAADAGHKYGKGMDKKTKALSATKHYRKKARGGSIEGDGKDDVSYGGTLPRSLQPITTQIPDSWMQRPLPKYRYADGGDVDWSRLNQPFGELKGTAPEDTPVRFKTASPYVNITEGDIERGMSIGTAAGPGVVGPLRSRILDAAYSAAGGRWNARAKISDIQKQLPDIPIEDLHNEMKLMQREEKATLMPLDNVRERTPADNESALKIGGNPRHILWVPRDPREMADGGEVPDVGEPMIPSGGQFSSGTAWGNKAADIGSRLAYGSMKSAATLYPRYIHSMVEASKYPAGSEEAREAYGDVGGATGELGMSMVGPKGGRPIAGTSGVFVGPYGAHMLREADRAAGRPTMPHPVVEAEIADKVASLRPEFRNIYKGQVQDMRDAEARAALEARQGSLNAPISDRDIWARSGWHRGSEGMIKKEIPDTGAKLVKNPDGGYKLEHPAGNLHEIYDVPPIKFDARLPKGNAQFDSFTNEITIGGKPTKENLESSVSAALHEFQHAIQKKEGFAYGSNIQQAQVRPEMSQEFFPSNQLSAAEIARYGPSLGGKAEIPSWHEKMAETQRARGENPASEMAAHRRAVYEAYRRSAGETEARNVQLRAKGNRYLEHPEDTADITSGLQWVDPRMTPRKRSDIKIGGKEFPGDSPTYRETKAGGGGVAGNFNPERGAAFGLTRQGMIKSTVPGRTDKLNLNVPSGSYVIPADIPSALGQGNTTAGGAILDRMFNKGPYGMNLPRARGGSRVGQRKSSLSKQSFAEGGDVGQITPILAAGGEYMIHPETVANLGNGDMDLGHSILDSFVKQVRAKHINTLKNLKPPKGS